jgi:glucose/arabinose dehydrogenase
MFIGLGAKQNLDGPSGRILSFPANGGATTVEATGLRTSYGLAFWGSHLLATVNGPDQAGKSPDEIVSFEPSGPVVNFGFPKCYGQGGAACSPYPKAFVTFPSHSTPAAIVVKGDVAFVADNGSGDPSYPARSEIVRIDLRTGHANVFWRSPVAHDLTGLAIGPDGDLYANGVVSGKILRFKL